MALRTATLSEGSLSWSKVDESLMDAVCKRDVLRVRSLVTKKKANPTRISPTLGVAAIHQAASFDKSDILVVLLTFPSIDVNKPDARKRTALHHAVREGRDECLDRLIRMGAKTMLVENEGLSALHLASMLGHMGCIRLLVSTVKSVDSKDDKGRTALFYAASRGSASSCRLLVEYGANVDATDNYGRTALMITIQNGHQAAYQYLLSRDADVSIRDKKGRDIRWYATNYNHTDLLLFLSNTTDRRNLSDTTNEEDERPAPSTQRKLAKKWDPEHDLSRADPARTPGHQIQVHLSTTTDSEQRSNSILDDESIVVQHQVALNGAVDERREQEWTKERLELIRKLTDLADENKELHEWKSKAEVTEQRNLNLLTSQRQIYPLMEEVYESVESCRRQVSTPEDGQPDESISNLQDVSQKLTLILQSMYEMNRENSGSTDEIGNAFAAELSRRDKAIRRLEGGAKEYERERERLEEEIRKLKELVEGQRNRIQQQEEQLEQDQLRIRDQTVSLGKFESAREMLSQVTELDDVSEDQASDVIRRIAEEYQKLRTKYKELKARQRAAKTTASGLHPSSTAAHEVLTNVNDDDDWRMKTLQDLRALKDLSATPISDLIREQVVVLRRSLESQTEAVLIGSKAGSRSSNPNQLVGPQKKLERSTKSEHETDAERVVESKSRCDFSEPQLSRTSDIMCQSLEEDERTRYETEIRQLRSKIELLRLEDSGIRTMSTDAEAEDDRSRMLLMLSQEMRRTPVQDESVGILSENRKLKLELEKLRSRIKPEKTVITCRAEEEVRTDSKGMQTDSELLKEVMLSRMVSNYEKDLLDKVESLKNQNAQLRSEIEVLSVQRNGEQEEHQSTSLRLCSEQVTNLGGGRDASLSSARSVERRESGKSMERRESGKGMERRDSQKSMESRNREKSMGRREKEKSMERQESGIRKKKREKDKGIDRRENRESVERRERDESGEGSKWRKSMERREKVKRRSQEGIDSTSESSDSSSEFNFRGSNPCIADREKKINKPVDDRNKRGIRDLDGRSSPRSLSRTSCSSNDEENIGRARKEHRRERLAKKASDVIFPNPVNKEDQGNDSSGESMDSHECGRRGSDPCAPEDLTKGNKRWTDNGKKNSIQDFDLGSSLSSLSQTSCSSSEENVERTSSEHNGERLAKKTSNMAFANSDYTNGKAGIENRKDRNENRNAENAERKTRNKDRRTRIEDRRPSSEDIKARNVDGKARSKETKTNYENRKTRSEERKALREDSKAKSANRKAKSEERKSGNENRRARDEDKNSDRNVGMVDRKAGNKVRKAEYSSTDDETRDVILLGGKEADVVALGDPALLTAEVAQKVLVKKLMNDPDVKTPPLVYSHRPHVFQVKTTPGRPPADAPKSVDGVAARPSFPVQASRPNAPVAAAVESTLGKGVSHKGEKGSGEASDLSNGNDDETFEYMFQVNRDILDPSKPESTVNVKRKTKIKLLRFDAQARSKLKTDLETVIQENARLREEMSSLKAGFSSQHKQKTSRNSEWIDPLHPSAASKNVDTVSRRQSVESRGVNIGQPAVTSSAIRTGQPAVTSSGAVEEARSQDEGYLFLSEDENGTFKFKEFSQQTTPSQLDPDEEEEGMEDGSFSSDASASSHYDEISHSRSSSYSGSASLISTDEEENDARGRRTDGRKRKRKEVKEGRPRRKVSNEIEQQRHLNETITLVRHNQAEPSNNGHRPSNYNPHHRHHHLQQQQQQHALSLDAASMGVGKESRLESSNYVKDQKEILLINGETLTDADKTQIFFLQKQLQDSEKLYRAIIGTYRSHLLASIQGCLDSEVADALCRIVTLQNGRSLEY